MKYEELIDALQLNEEQKELVTKFQQSTEDRIRTDYSKQIKALEDANSELEKLKPIEKTAEQLELESVKSELANMRFKASLKELGVNDTLCDYIRLDADMNAFKGVYDSLKLSNNNDFVPTLNQGAEEFTKEQFKNMGIAERTKIYNESPELYAQLSK